MNELIVTNDELPDEWMDADLLDFRILEHLLDEQRTRNDIAQRFDITKDKARSRLEKLSDHDLAEKEEICRSCENEITLCNCGRYAKKILYTREAEEGEREQLREFRDALEEYHKTLNGD